MSAFCFCGICVPYSVIWPLVLFLIKPIYEFVLKFFGWDKVKDQNGSMCCKDGVCSFTPDSVKNSEKSSQSSSQDCKSGDNINNIDGNVFSLSGGLECFQDILKKNPNVIVRFTASWCKPCKEIEPYFNSLGEKFKNIIFLSVDVDDNNDVFEKYEGFSVPLFLSFKFGNVTERFSGADKSKLNAMAESF